MQPRSRHTSFGSATSSNKSAPGTPVQLGQPGQRPTGGRLSALLKPLTPISGVQQKQTTQYAPPPGAPPSRRGSVNMTSHPAGASRLATMPSAPYSSTGFPIQPSTDPRPRSYTSNPYIISHDSRPASPRTSVGQVTPAGERVRRRSSLAFDKDTNVRRPSLAEAQGLQPLKPRKSFFGSISSNDQDQKVTKEEVEDKLHDAIQSFSLAWNDLFGTIDVENTLINQTFDCFKGLKSACTEINSVIMASFNSFSLVEKAKIVVALDDLSNVLQKAGQLTYSKYPISLYSTKLEEFLNAIPKDPEFHSLFLTALEPLTILIDMTTDLRRKVVYTLLDALAGGNNTHYLRSALLIIRNILQMLTGSQVAPAIHAIGDYIIGLEQILTEIPSIVRNAITEPINLNENKKPFNYNDAFSNILNAAFISTNNEPKLELHSLGYSYVPSNCTARVGIINNRLAPLFSSKLPTSSLKFEVNKLLDSISGNSRVARVQRSISRIRSYAPLGKTLIEVLREATKNLLTVQLDKFEGEDNDFKYSFSNVDLTLLTLVPEKTSIDSHTSISFNEQNAFTPNTDIHVNVNNLTFKAKDVKYKYTQKGIVGVSDEGSADLGFLLNCVIYFNSNGQYKGYSINVHKCEFNVNGGEGIKANIYKTFWPYVHERVKRTIQSGMENWIDGYLASIKDLFNLNSIMKDINLNKGINLSLNGPSEVTKQFFQTPRQRKESNQLTNNQLKSQYLSQHPIGARDAFRAEIEQHPSLRGDLLKQLENPFSGPSSVGNSRRNSISGDDEKILGRRKSMADSLTETSKVDSTLKENINTPKIDRGNLLIPEVEGYENMADSLTPASTLDTTKYENIREPVISQEADIDSAREALLRRGSVSALGESATLSDYPINYEDEVQKHYNEEYPSMSMSLNSRNSIDATQLESIKNPPKAENESTGFATGSRMSMRERTMSLSGQDNEIKPTFNPVDRYDYLRYGDSAIADDEDIGPGPESQPMMSKSIPKEMTVDNTLTENRIRQQEGRPSMNAGLPADQVKGRRMSNVLNDEAKVDATLQENIASPPASRSPSISRRKSRPSMNTEIKRKPSMSEIGLNEKVTQDGTIIDPNEKVPKGDRRRLSRPANDEFDGEGKGGPGTGASKSNRRQSMAESLTDDMKKDNTIF